MLATVVMGAMAGCQERSSQPSPALQSLVEGKALATAISAPQVTAAERKHLTEQIRRFYEEHEYRLVWIAGDRPSRRHRELAMVIEAAADHGLPPELYPLPLAGGDGTEVDIPEDRAPELDVKTTASFFRYFLHLTAGRIDARALQPLWTLRPERPDLVAALSQAVRDNDLGEATERLQPAHAQYRALQSALARYRAIAADGGWPAIPPKTRLKPGASSDAVAALRRRLAIEGDLDPSREREASPVFDEALAEAVKRFEERHRIEPDGIVDAATVDALNVPVEQRIRTIELNLERWRWLPDRMPDRYIAVNVPDFRLEVVENGRTVMDMRVVVGEAENKTPIFADEMTHVVFSPYWNVPPGIAEEETIPSVLSDPEFLERNNMEVVTSAGKVVDPYTIDWSNSEGLRIRQRPGRGNALGGVKFMFPNNFNVYLHDTNATRLFDRLERGFSHGCVRVEEPHALAQYVLRDLPEWTPEAIAQAMKSGREKHVKLNTPIPVYILYNTALAHDGAVRFVKDIYGHDARQAARLWGK